MQNVEEKVYFIQGLGGWGGWPYSDFPEKMCGKKIPFFPVKIRREGVTPGRRPGTMLVFHYFQDLVKRNEGF